MAMAGTHAFLRGGLPKLGSLLTLEANAPAGTRYQPGSRQMPLSRSSPTFTCNSEFEICPVLRA